MLLSSNSTDKLLNSFPMFGHPGISALEYAGQADMMREQSTRMSEVSLKHKSTTGIHNDNAESTTVAGAEQDQIEGCPPVHYIDEFGCQQRRRGAFVNHTPRNFEMRWSKPVDMCRPPRAESENYSRPLSRQSSMASGNPAIANPPAQSQSIVSGTFEKKSTIDHSDMTELNSMGAGSPGLPEVHIPSKNSHRRSLSAPLSKILAYQPDATDSTDHLNRDPSLLSTSLSDHQPQERKRQRRQTPFQILTSTQISISRHASLEPWIAEHCRTGTNESIGDVPFDMDREVSAEIGTFGAIRRCFDSQGSNQVWTPKTTFEPLPSSPHIIPLPKSLGLSPRKPSMEPIAIYPIDKLGLPDEPPPVPDRSPKRLTNPAFPLLLESKTSTDSDFKVAAEGAYSPYDDNDDQHAPKMRARTPLMVGQFQAASANGGRLAPTILGHDAQVASSDLRLDELSYFLKHTGPPESSKQRKQRGIGLFKVKQRKSLAARVGSVEGSPQRTRTRPVVPECAREMTTSSGARHLRIIIPTDTPCTSQAIELPESKKRAKRHSRHISIAFTEEMLNPLASADVERMISSLETPKRSLSAPVSKSPRSPKRLPRLPKPVPVNEHPLASRDELTRARKLRDLQRIKRKPVLVHTLSEQRQDTTGVAPPARTHNSKPFVEKHSHEDEGSKGQSPANVMSQLQDKVISLERQNTQLAEALAKIMGLEIDDGESNGKDVLEAFSQIRAVGC